MAVGGTASIFRIDTTGETETDAETANETIEFGSGAANPDARSHISSVTYKGTEDISIHPNPNRARSQIQPGKLGPEFVTIRGFFDRPNSSGGLTKLINWMRQDKDNASLPFGRFGLRLDALSQLNLTPTASSAYFLQDVFLADIEDFESRVEFVIILYRNGA